MGHVGRVPRWHSSLSSPWDGNTTAVHSPLLPSDGCHCLTTWHDAGHIGGLNKYLLGGHKDRWVNEWINR